MHKVMVLALTSLLVMCTSSGVVEESTLTLFKGGMFSADGNAVYLFKQKIKFQETRSVSLGIFDTYTDTELVESSSIIEFDRSGRCCSGIPRCRT